MRENCRETNYVMKILYAIGMICVVAGHCEEGGISLFYDWFPPYTFHLALFAFASGYLYHYDGERGLGEFIGKKFRKLIIPVYLWNLFYWGVVQLMERGGFTIGTGLSLPELFLDVIKTGHGLGYTLAGWFVIPLFMVQCFNAFLCRALKKLGTRHGDMAALILNVILGLAGVALAMAGYHTGWWLVLVRMLFFLPFFGVGRFYKTHLERYDHIPNSWYFAVIFAIQLLIIIVRSGMPSYLASWCNIFDSIWMPYLIGFTGIAFWLRVAKLLEPVIGRSKWVALIADNTYGIMMNHLMGIMVIKSVFAALNGLTGLCSSFDWVRYRTDLWYLYVIKELPQTRILYLIGGIVFSLGMIWCQKQLWKVLCKKRKSKQV